MISVFNTESKKEFAEAGFYATMDSIRIMPRRAVGEGGAMKKESQNFLIPLAESACLVMGLIYIGLQCYYGIYYRISPLKLILNILMAAAVYAVLTLLAVYPERINGLRPEECEGKIRQYSIRMVLLVKVIFMVSLLVPCVFDVLGIGMKEIAGLAVAGVILAVVVYYEYRIIRLLRKRK